MQQHFRIIGSGRYLPSFRIDAESLDARYGDAAGTCFRRTGVKTRYQAVLPEDGASMARKVTSQALTDAGIQLREIDLIIDASLCQQQPIPCNAALLQEALGPEAAGIPCMDVHASCLGFVAALKVVNGLFACESARRILVICTETPLKGVNWDEPESACLMGDGASAFLFEASRPQEGCVITMETFAEGARACEVMGGGHRLPAFSYQPHEHHRYLFHMEGKAVHKLASRLLPPLFERAVREAGCALDDLDVIPHQASGPSLALMGRRLGIPPERYHVSIADHGNLVAASIPYVLHQVRQTRSPGSRILLMGTAAGYSQAVAIFRL